MATLPQRLSFNRNFREKPESIHAKIICGAKVGFYRQNFNERATEIRLNLCIKPHFHYICSNNLNLIYVEIL